MDTVRLARDLGDVSGLLPDGVKRLRDIPYQLMQAIKTALIYLSFEELGEEDQPPRSIWTDNELLKEHFDMVKARHRDGAEGRGAGGKSEKNHALGMLIAE